MHSLNLDAEATLAPEIVPQAEEFVFNPRPHIIFLTGATGFVGAYLLRELLEQTQADIYCLVRADNTQHAFDRIRSNLEQYYLWQEHYTPRVLPIVGDMKLPLFGLTPDEFQSLANIVDSIYHCGSKLSYVAPLHYLKSANVGGTQEALRMATMGKPKPVHFVSSLGILLAYRELVGGQEDDEMDPEKCPDVGYFQSKYAAERVVRLARERGIPVTIHRIGLIVGDSTSGASNPTDFVGRMLVGCIQAGVAPDIQHPMDWTPVDFVSKAMVYLSLCEESLGKVFHLLNPEPIQWSQIYDRVIETGYPVRKLPFREWVDAFEAVENPDTNPLHPLLPFLHGTFARRMLGISETAYHALGTTLTQSALQDSGIVCPPIDRKLVQLYLTQMVRKGELHPAAATGAAIDVAAGEAVPVELI